MKQKALWLALCLGTSSWALAAHAADAQATQAPSTQNASATPVQATPAAETQKAPAGNPSPNNQSTAAQAQAPVQQSQDTAQQTLQQARSDLASGQGQAAYDALLPLVDQMAGTPNFDNLFGQAALAVHQDTRAAMSFERCLAVEPNNGNCRLGMAEAYVRLDEKQSAHDELEAIKQSSPPPQVAKVVDQYLGELTGAQAAEQQRLHAWVGLSLGHDSNTNVSPSTSNITLPGFSGGGGTFSSATDSSAFDQATAGLAYKAPVTEHWDFLSGLDTQATGNYQVPADSYFNTVSQVGGYLGMGSHYGKHRYGVMLQAQNYALGGQSYYNMGGVLGQYSYLFSKMTQISAFLQSSQFNYQYGRGANLQNVNSTSVGVSVAHSLMQNQVVAFGGVYMGNDRKVESAADPSVGSKYVGLRGGATWLFQEGWQAGADLLLESRKYGGDSYMAAPLVVYDYSRKDTLVSTDLNVAWQVIKNVALTSQYTYINNDSNVPIRKYDRQIISMGVRYDFL